MYSLIKLFAEEPEKLERVVMAILKFLITCWVVSTFSQLNIFPFNLFESASYKNVSVSVLLLTFSVFIVFWIVTWIYLAELIFGELLIWLMSRLFNYWSLPFDILEVTSVIKRDRDAILPGKNVLILDEWLENFDPEGGEFIGEMKSRIRQYYMISVVMYMILWLDKSIETPGWLYWVGGLIVLGFFLSSSLYHSLHKYIKSNLGQLRRMCGQLAFTRLAFNAVNQNKVLCDHYDIKLIGGVIQLLKTSGDESLPSRIKIGALKSYNHALGEEIIGRDLMARLNAWKGANAKSGRWDILISNVELSAKNVSLVESQPNMVFINGVDYDQIRTGLELALYKISNGQYLTFESFQVNRIE